MYDLSYGFLNVLFSIEDVAFLSVATAHAHREKTGIVAKRKPPSHRSFTNQANDSNELRAQSLAMTGIDLTSAEQISARPVMPSDYIVSLASRCLLGLERATRRYEVVGKRQLYSQRPRLVL